MTGLIVAIIVNITHDNNELSLLNFDSILRRSDSDMLH